MHNGETYFARNLDWDGKLAYVERRDTDYYTQAVLDDSVQVTRKRMCNTLDGDTPLGAVAGSGEADVTWKTIGSQKIKFHSRDSAGYGPVDNPAQDLMTTAVWLRPQDDMILAMKAARFQTNEALCGLRNLAVVALPMIAMCDSRDLGWRCRQQ